ncbi:nucleoside-diphosphate kinase [Natrinema salinisoli]|uniref:nucleoside-diphosphate kinase n=1 Tax=Natrinema salinisoli TaxID=2878535 RepID=UPI001CF0C7B3|nr:nucleoside-diphosphate kinase [Natrinema salinisoli]
MATQRNRTLIILKPDAVKRNIIGTVLAEIESAGLELARLKTVDADRELIKVHYREKQDEDFYDALVDWMTDLVIVGIIEGENAAERMKQLVGDTEPASAAPGTIRGKYSDDSYSRADAEDRPLHNVIHASEPGEAEEEIALWFGE